MVMLANLIPLFVMVARASYTAGGLRLPRFTYGQATTAVGANLLVSVMMRNDHVVNCMFTMALSLPHWVPLAIRTRAAKVYSYGGIHSACGVAAFFWYIFFAVLVITQFRGEGSDEDALAITTALMLMLFIFLIVLAHPWIRSRLHDVWELSHRFAGWTSIGIVWAQIFIIANAETKRAYPGSHLSHFGTALAKTPASWFLMITLMIIYPWIHLRRRSFEAEQLSSHAIRLKFNYRKVPIGAAVRISDSPLTQTHAFAVIPNPDGSRGYSVIISNAGDWTKKFINDPKRPNKLWMKGLPTLGVVHISSLFKPVVVVATGSGIGPCLSFLQMHRRWPVRIVWSARFPEVTYGTSVVASMLESDKDAIIIDTKKTGTPDLAGIVYASYREIGAEAVVIISNQKVTEKVVYTLETRGVPAFGAIFDS
ncbi:hypothetical protein M409DRAFT_69547 [Zasmidium cellare ATCC 36951]|uniref:FAD-binding FR-type domain-containing protein n=1 Tax=Zasmidium cellare ATCC 36951 TaxID=1080233 RepID=A0A6A6C7M7_ZASCE|nr:uncharacterized protein M409DRAFT_69547 [Zasmidium cellare ATCC 36951]KAF2161739.1 hypothetical protein M409DRAFT_69547 [Zasmidium cellare ATCC 36951]